MANDSLEQFISQTLPANDKIYTKTEAVRRLMNRIAGDIKPGALFPEIPSRIDPSEGTAGYRGIVEHAYGFLGRYNDSEEYENIVTIEYIYKANGQSIPPVTITIPPKSWGYFDSINYHDFYDEYGPFEIPYIEAILHNSFYNDKSGWAFFGIDANEERAMIFDNIVDARIENNFKRMQIDFETFNVPFPMWSITRRL
jgi:hypothetical protein